MKNVKDFDKFENENVNESEKLGTINIHIDGDTSNSI